ncbi:MAG: hypothetical protein ACKVT2_22605 [Saprospiraceae bacterium]
MLIEQYYRSELSESERVAFEKRLASEPDLQEEFKLHEMAMAAIRFHGRDLLKQQLRERPLIEKPRWRRYWLWAGLSGIVVLVGVFFCLDRDKPQVPPDNSDRPIVLKSDSIPDKNSAITNPELLPTPKKPLPKAINVNQLYAKAYRPYKEGTGTTLGSDPQSPDTSNLASIELLKQLAEVEKFDSSLAVYNRLSPELQNEEIALFYKANSLMALGNTKEGAILFESIALDSNATFISEAQWYAALCALKKKDLRNTKKWLRMVTAEGSYASETLRKKAIRLLNKLQ